MVDSFIGIFGRFNLSSENLYMLQFLIVTLEDFVEFETKFWKGEGQQFFAISQFRLHKIMQRDMTLEEFCELYINNNAQALTELFMQPIDSKLTNAIVNKVSNGELTLEYIYDNKFSDNRTLNITKLTHKRRFVSKNKG